MFCSITSPRLRGEVEIRDSEFRVRGTLRETECVDKAPHPNPLRASLARLSPPRAGRGGGRSHASLTKYSPLVRENNRATGGEHAADAVADRNLRAWNLRRRDAAHLPHALLQRVHA